MRTEALGNWIKCDYRRCLGWQVSEKNIFFVPGCANIINPLWYEHSYLNKHQLNYFSEFYENNVPCGKLYYNADVKMVSKRIFPITNQSIARNKLKRKFLLLFAWKILLSSHGTVLIDFYLKYTRRMLSIFSIWCECVLKYNSNMIPI